MDNAKVSNTLSLSNNFPNTAKEVCSINKKLHF